MKKVIIEDGLSVTDNKAGVGNFTISLISLLKVIEIKYNHVKPPKFFYKIKQNFIKRVLHIFWLNTFFILYLMIQKKPTTLIATSFQLPLIKINGVKYISVIHDLTPYRHPEFFSKTQLIYSKFAIKNAIRVADTIFTVSETVRNEIIEQLNYSSDKIEVIYNMLTPKLETINCKDILDKYNISQEGYILSVATLNKRKNIPNLIKAFNIVNKKHEKLKLVLVGAGGNDFSITKNLDKEKNNFENIVFTGYVSENELTVLYQNAIMYVFPSLYEGFGIPILEAQSYNIPVLCSDIPVFREIAGNSALFFKPSIEGMTKAIEKLLNNDELRKELIYNACKNIEKFSEKNLSHKLKNLLNK